MTTDRTAAPVRPSAPERSARADLSPAASGFAELLGGAHAASLRPAARAASQLREPSRELAPQLQVRPAAPEAPQGDAPADHRPAAAQAEPVPFVLTVTGPPAAAPAPVAVTVAPAAAPPAPAPAAPAGAVAASARTATPVAAPPPAPAVEAVPGIATPQPAV